MCVCVSVRACRVMTCWHSYGAHGVPWPGAGAVRVRAGFNCFRLRVRNGSNWIRREASTHPRRHGVTFSEPLLPCPPLPPSVRQPAPAADSREATADYNILMRFPGGRSRPAGPLLHYSNVVLLSIGPCPCGHRASSASLRVATSCSARKLPSRLMPTPLPGRDLVKVARLRGRSGRRVVSMLYLFT